MISKGYRTIGVYDDLTQDKVKVRCVGTQSCKGTHSTASSAAGSGSTDVQVRAEREQQAKPEHAQAAARAV
eukprot:jgi/Ulvmu1/7214/UM034_0123.1